MLKTRTISIGMVLTLLFALVLSVSPASAQEDEEEIITLGGAGVQIRDGGVNPSSRVVIALEDLPLPPAGMVYEGWLVGRRDAKISTGVFYRAVDGTVNMEWTHPEGANLLAHYTAFAITHEPSPDPDPETPGEVVYADTLDSGAYIPLLNLLVAWDDAPDEKGLAVGLREQLMLARTLARAVVTADDLAGQQAAAQRVHNVVKGSDSDGDGFGAATYAEHMSEQLAAALLETVDGKAVMGVKSAMSSNDQVRLNLIQVANGAENLIQATGDEPKAELDSYVRNIVEPLDTGALAVNAAYTGAQDMATFVPILGAQPGIPGVGDSLVPTVARGLLLFGAIAVAIGAVLLFYRRRAVAVQMA